MSEYYARTGFGRLSNFYHPIFRGVILSSCCSGGGGLFGFFIENQLTFLFFKQFGMCISLCMNFKGASHNSVLTVQTVLFISTVVRRQKQFRINRRMDGYHKETF